MQCIFGYAHYTSFWSGEVANDWITGNNMTLGKLIVPQIQVSQAPDKKNIPPDKNLWDWEPEKLIEWV